MTIFHLVRHAEKASDPDLLTGRAPGVPLTPRGLDQAEQLAARFAHTEIGYLGSSPLERAQATAAAISRVTGRTVHTLEALTELDWGDWTGRRCSELEGDPRWRRFNTFRSGTRIPGGETFAEVQSRLVHEILRLRDETVSGAVVLVSHADPIKAALLYFLGLPLDAWNRFDVGLASVSSVAVGKDEARVLTLNHELAEADD